MSSVSKLCGIKEATKGKFPFHLLDSMDYLDTKSFPTNARDWCPPDASEMLGPPPTQSEVDEVLEICKTDNHLTIGSYLRKYLKDDVILLLRSVEKITKVFYQLLGINLIEARKATVSGLSSLGSQIWLARRLHVGLFSCNDTTIYSVTIHILHFV